MAELAKFMLHDDLHEATVQIYSTVRKNSIMAIRVRADRLAAAGWEPNRTGT